MIFEAGGTTIKHIYITRLVKMPIAFPPPAEQDRVCRHVNDVRDRLDAVLRRCDDSLRGLREYRQALITAAVTGKLDLRDEPAA